MMADAEMPIYDQAQTALAMLECEDLDMAIAGLTAVLKRIGPDDPDAAVIKPAVDRLDAIAWEIADILVVLRIYARTTGYCLSVNGKDAS